MPGILKKTEHHHSRLIGARDDVAFHKQLGENRRRGTNITYYFEGTLQAGFVTGMVIVDMQLHVRTAGNLGQRSDSRSVAYINENQAFDFFQINIFRALDIISIEGAFQQKMPESTLLPSGEDQHRVRIQTLRRDHRAQTIKICVDVGCYDIHAGTFFKPAMTRSAH